MRAMIRASILTMLLTAVGMAQTSAPDVNTVVSRMQTAMGGRNHDRAYSVTREYRLVPEDPNKASRVVAEVNALPSGKKDYRITEGGGQAENVVRKVLDHETEVTNQNNGAVLTADNYDFVLAGTEAIDGHRCYVLQLKPKRDGKDILRGRAWVDADSYLVRQIAGTPTKSPSWWIKDLQVTLHYREMQGLWLQDSTQAVAQVRVVGKHTLTARALDVRTDTTLAGNLQTPVRKRSRRVDPALLGAGVIRH
ncbi:hypothetical protein Acid345_1266 [Candidatus Koribacter versatilis Ellin345]|uniref:Uncharacterized protein TP-0789 domain-containing protein n=1 Tax=Koribacter versatilis (strain Ellin345) TaxID=204669 RepID=Q1IS82_KORVE|nr:outer membrane lipoprotein-sorting protein [Candidatus Koribacter versatilis]ABF40268.1 hypothetical protein Acid345_1266 [Candidatus Koribacter versatilis Ellin345]